MNSQLLNSNPSLWPFRWSVLLACATFPLIWVGGLVTTYDAGMAVPDWPNTYGYNLFLYPIGTWLAGPWDLFIEHGHRLLGALVGFITIGLVISVWRHEQRNWMKILVVIALAAVIFQGVLGGMRVRFNDRQLAMLHGCFGPAFFAFTTLISLFLSKTWCAIRPMTRTPGTRLMRIATVLTGLSFLQLIMGATMRHLPSFVTADLFRITVVFHLLTGLAVLGHAVAIRWRVERDFSGVQGLRRPARWLVHLVAIQIALGIGTWIGKYGWPEWFAGFDIAAGHLVQAKALFPSLVVTSHVATGSLILALSSILTAQSARRFLLLATPTIKLEAADPSDRTVSRFQVAREVSA